MMRERLSGLLYGFMPVQLAYVMARLRLADLVEESPASVAELSTRPRSGRTSCAGSCAGWPASACCGWRPATGSC